MRSVVLMLALGFVAIAAGAEPDWSPFADADVIRIVTQDEDGAERDTKVWLVMVDGAPFVRTGDSCWLTNIRRGSRVALRLDTTESAVTAEEVADAATRGASRRPSSRSTASCSAS